MVARPKPINGILFICLLYGVRELIVEFKGFLVLL
jgi:hypothetical protein